MLARIKTRKTPINIDNVTVARMFYPQRVYAPILILILLLILILAPLSFRRLRFLL